MNLFCLLFCFSRQTKQFHSFVFWENCFWFYLTFRRSKFPTTERQTDVQIHSCVFQTFFTLVTYDSITFLIIFLLIYKLTVLLYLDKFRISSHSAGLPAIQVKEAIWPTFIIFSMLLSSNYNHILAGKRTCNFQAQLSFDFCAHCQFIKNEL